MTTAADLLALADRVEREEPSRELDACVLVAFGHRCVERGRLGWQYWQNGSAPLWRSMPSPTTSLDAAASLVPSGAVWLRKSEKAMTVAFYGRGQEWGVHTDATGPNPAAALTAAALRAMAQEAADE